MLFGLVWFFGVLGFGGSFVVDLCRSKIEHRLFFCWFVLLCFLGGGRVGPFRRDEGLFLWRRPFVEAGFCGGPFCGVDLTWGVDSGDHFFEREFGALLFFTFF